MEQLQHLLVQQLEDYLVYGSSLYATIHRRAMARRDLVVDGRQSPREQAQPIAQTVRQRIGR
jgi:hypothetical protein